MQRTPPARLVIPLLWRWISSPSFPLLFLISCWILLVICLLFSVKEAKLRLTSFIDRRSFLSFSSFSHQLSGLSKRFFADSKRITALFYSITELLAVLSVASWYHWKGMGLGILMIQIPDLMALFWIYWRLFSLEIIMKFRVFVAFLTLAAGRLFDEDARHLSLTKPI